MYPSQSNTQLGARPILAGENLTDMEARLVMLTHDTGVAEVKLPASTDNVYGLLVDGNADTKPVVVEPWEPTRNRRVVLKGTCNPGNLLYLADHSVAADKGKVRTEPAAAGTYRVVGMAEEAGVDGQLVLVRPISLPDTTVTE